MKSSITIFSLLLLSLYGSAQKIATPPLVIQGKLSNSPERLFKIYFEDENYQLVLDTIRLNEAGEFYLQTSKITKPQRTSIQQNATQINRIYVAPGYNLTITGDARDFRTLAATKRITGIGATSNQYRVKLDSMYATKKETTGWYDLELDSLILFTQKQKAYEDSIVQRVFIKSPHEDKYLSFFKRMIQVDNQSMQFYMLLQHFLMKKYSYEKMTSLLKTHTPALFKTGISKDEYLLSEDYKTWLMTTYFNYSKLLDKLKDSTLANTPAYELAKVNKTFQGKTRDLYFFKLVNSAIGSGNSIARLNAARKATEPYLAAINSEAQKQVLTEAFEEKEKQLLLLETGKPAPAFKLVSNTGKYYQLADFKGKVIYFDLWASWCGPCRQEIPNFRQLYTKYKDNGNISFVGVAVYDGEKEWRNALADDKPEWLQLYDKEGIIAKSYMANAIPKYIIIDKNGNVANFDAPGPGSREAIEKIIEKELARETP